MSDAPYDRLKHLELISKAIERMDKASFALKALSPAALAQLAQFEVDLAFLSEGDLGVINGLGGEQRRIGRVVPTKPIFF